MSVPVPRWRRRESAAKEFATDEEIAGWKVSRRAGNFGGSATWWARHRCGGPEQIVLGTQLRAGGPKFCDACRPKPPGTVTLTGRLRPKRRPR